MHFWNRGFFLLYIFNYVVRVSSEIAELKFNITTLGHSGLLIYWHPAKVDECYRLSIDWEPMEATTDDVTSRFDADKERVLNNSHLQNLTNCDGVFKINALLEDTEYIITIKDNITKRNYTLKGKTNLINNAVPEKPYFTLEKISSMDYAIPILRVKWVPCGQKRNCQGNSAGTHFAVKYKILDLRTVKTVVQHSASYHDIFYVYSGKIYEVVVISINGDFETESDPQEFFLKPASGPVHSVKVSTLPNNSVYIAWKKPRTMPTEGCFYILQYSSVNINELLWVNTIPDDVIIEKSSDEFWNQKVIVGLTPNIIYTFLIIPTYGDYTSGYEYRFDYSSQTIKANSTLTKPDFRFIYVRRLKSGCLYNVYWLPCARTFDCTNMSPGSTFKLKEQYDDKGVHSKVMSPDWVQLKMKFKLHEPYSFVGESVDEFNRSSQSVTKQIFCKNN